MADDNNIKGKAQNENVEEQVQEPVQNAQAEEKVEPEAEVSADASASAQASADKEAMADKQEEAPTPEVKEPKKPSKDLSGKLAKIAEQIEGLTVLELSELAGYLEEKFGVTAMAVAAPAAGGAPAGGGAAAEPTEEKSTFNVILKDAGANKLAVIKAVREVKQDLGLMDAKKLVESAPKEVAAGMKKDDAQEAKKKLEDAGATVELQ